MSLAAAVPAAPTRHRHPKMYGLAFIGKPWAPSGRKGGRPILAEISRACQCWTSPEEAGVPGTGEKPATALESPDVPALPHLDNGRLTAGR